MPQYPDTSKTLIEKIRAGDELSWQEFYDQYENVILGIGEQAGLSRPDCEDLVQDVMAKFSHYSQSFHYTPGLTKFRTYFHSIVRSRLAEIIKRVQKETDAKHELSPAEPEPDLDAIFMKNWRKAVFQDALRQLANQVEEKTYLAFTMTALDQVPVAETADFLQITHNQVYLSRNRCIASLKKIVSTYNTEDPDLHLPEEFDHV